MKRNRLWVLLTAFAMTFLVAGTVLAATGPSDQGVTPVLHDGDNITLDGNGNSDAADCDAADGIETGDTGGSDTTDNGVSVTWTYDSGTKEFGFTATGGVVLIAYVKGGNGYNEYDYSGLGGVTSDGGMFAPDNGSDGPAGLSHAVFCTGPSAETSSTTSFESSEESTTDVQSSSSTTSFSDSVSDSTSQPPTDTIGNTGSGQQSSGLWMLLAALGVLAGSVIVLAPSKAKSKD